MKHLIALAALALATPALAEEATVFVPPMVQTDDTQRILEQAEHAKLYRSARNWTRAYQVLNAVDAVQSCYAINSGRGVEGNPFMPKSCKGIVAVKVASSALQAFLFHHITVDNDDPHAARKAAKFAVIFQGAIVGLNMKAIF